MMKRNDNFVHHPCHLLSSIKPMKINLLLLAVVLFAAGRASAQVCTPDPNIKSPGISPESLPDATVEVSYSEVIQFKLPKDTAFSGIQATIDSVKIDSVYGFPKSFTYQLNLPSKKYPGGANGCATISGTPLPGSARLYFVKVAATATLRTGFGTFPSPYIDSLPMLVLAGTNSIQPPYDLSGHTLSQNKPNPFTSSTSFDYFTPEGGKVQIHIYDVLGKLQYAKTLQVTSGKNQLEIDNLSLSKGIYLFSLAQDDYHVTRRISVKD